MKSELTFPKRRRLLLGSVAICVVLMAGLAVWWQSGKFAEAAILNPTSPSLPATLMGWWRFDEGTGIAANDSSGNGNNGTIYGGTWVDGKYGTALSFNGASTYVQVPNSASLQFGTGSFTISAWIKPHAFTDREAIVVKSDWPGAYYLFDVNSNNGLHFEISDGSNAAGGDVNNTLSADTWAYVTLIVDRTNKLAAIYVDGSQAGGTFDISGVTGSISPTSPLYVGTNHITMFNGTIDEVRIYNSGLSPNPISPSLPAGLVGWWRFDEGTGIAANDSSGNGNNGAIYGGTWVDGKYGTALSFNGASSYAQVPNSPSLQFGTGSFTISAWIKPHNFTDRAPIVIKSDWPGAFYLLDLNSNNGLHFEISDGSHGAGADINNVLSVDTWAYVTLVVDRANKVASVYVDGSLVGTSFDISGVTGAISPTNPLNIAAGHATLLNGVIDEVRIYNSALSGTQIQTDFQTNPGFALTLIAKIPMGTTQVITTISWQGSGSINATITSPAQIYTEDTIPVYQKTTYSTSAGAPNMLNVKRLSISINALKLDQSWSIELAFDSVTAYQISVEVQK